MKRIIFTVTNDLTYDRRMQKICTTLSEAGYEVLLVGRALSQSPALQERPYRQKRMKCLFNKGKLFYLEYNLRLTALLLFSNADIFSAVDLDTALPHMIAAKVRGKKFVYDAHEYFTEVPEVVERPLVKKIWLWVEKAIVPRSDKCYTVSQSLAKLFEEKYSKTFDVILNAPLLAPSISAPTANEEKFILYQGALNRGRGLETLIKAMKNIPMKLKIAGEGDLSEELRDLVKKLELTHKVEFLGRLLPEQLDGLTVRAYIGYNILAAEGLSYYFSLSNKFFDYMHAGVPSLSNDFPEYRIFNDRFEVTVLSELNEAAIQEAVNKLLQDAGYYERLRANCLMAREAYNWQKEEIKLTEIYRFIY